LVALLLGMLVGCKPPERRSTSGRYVPSTILEEDNQGRWIRFQVRERSGHVVFISPTRWAARHRTEYAFDDTERIWFYSSDVGTSVWRHIDDDRWEEMKPDDWSGLTAPEPVASAQR
jgi:hypothetical protein